MLFKRFRSKPEVPYESPPQATLGTLIEQIQAGDVVLRNQFLSDYRPFIAKAASKLCKKYIDPSRDDEFSVALTAFNEAIDHYSAHRGGSFLSFAETVIQRRLIDFLRKEKRFQDQIPLTSFDIEDDESQSINPVEVKESFDRYSLDREAEERRLEIQHYAKTLQAFGITMQDLVQGSPKHADSRNMLLYIGQLVAENPIMSAHLKEKKMLPMKELLTHVDVTRKTLERNRKYIIAVALIQMGPFHYLKEYLHIPQAKEGGER